MKSWADLASPFVTPNLQKQLPLCCPCQAGVASRRIVRAGKSRLINSYSSSSLVQRLIDNRRFASAFAVRRSISVLRTRSLPTRRKHSNAQPDSGTALDSGAIQQARSWDRVVGATVWIRSPALAGSSGAWYGDPVGRSDRITILLPVAALCATISRGGRMSEGPWGGIDTDSATSVKGGAVWTWRPVKR